MVLSWSFGEMSQMYTQLGYFHPAGKILNGCSLKWENFEHPLFPENTLLEIRSFPGATIGGSQVIRMNFKNIVSGIWKLFVYGTGNGKAVRYLAANKQLLKKKPSLLIQVLSRPLPHLEMHSMLSPMQHMMWQQAVCTSGPAKDIQETEELFRTSQHREYQ